MCSNFQLSLHLKKLYFLLIYVVFDVESEFDVNFRRSEPEALYNPEKN